MSESLSEMFSVFRGQEYLNDRSPQPLGTLAAEVLQRPIKPLGGPWTAKVLAAWRFMIVPAEDATRLVAIAGSDLNAVRALAVRRALSRRKGALKATPANTVWGQARRQLLMVRRLAEASLDERSGPVGVPSRAYYAAALRAMVRWQIPLVELRPAGRPAGEHFEVTPAGAVLLSAVYGRLQGRLRACKGCGKLAAFRRVGFERRYCDGCRGLTAGKPKLSHEKQCTWERFKDRMRKGGYERNSLDTPQERHAFDMAARAHLLTIPARADLSAWEDKWALKVKTGRPRTGGQRRGGHQN